LNNTSPSNHIQNNRHYQHIKFILLIGLTLSLFISIWIVYAKFQSQNLFIFRLIASRKLYLVIMLHLLFVGIIFRKKVFRTIKQFFLTPGHSGNLSFFRIVFFWMLFIPNSSYLIKLSQLPKELHNASWQLPHWFLDVFPINELWMTIAILLFRVFCLLACIGLFTRFSSIIALILGFYVMGAPQYIGKLNHTHHMFWFLAVLATSRCGDSLSIDRLLTCWKTKSKNYFLEHSPSIVYSLPLRLIWILIGIVYFFPGFWKIWGGGLDWILSDHLKNYMYFKWMSYDFIPSFRIDKYPLLLKISAGSIILFELSFIFLIFSSRLRYLAVLGGLVFHKVTQIFLNIFFSSLVISYVVFFDWQKIWYWFEKNFLMKFKKLPFYKLSQKQPSQVPLFKLGKPYAVILCGLILIVGNIYCGFNNYHSWPFSCYPTFMEMKLHPRAMVLSMDVFNSHGQEIMYDKKKNFYSPDQRREFLATLLNDWNNRNRVDERLRGYFKNWVKNEKNLNNVTYVEFYIDTIDIRPDHRLKTPIKREKIHNIAF